MSTFAGTRERAAPFHYNMWPFWLYPNVPADRGVPKSFQKKVYLFLTRPHAFEQPAWLTQLVLALLVWNSTLFQNFTAFLLFLLFAGTGTEVPPMSLVIAALTGSMIVRGKYLIAILAMLKMFVIDNYVQNFNSDSTGEYGRLAPI